MEYLVVDVDNRKINIPESITHLGVKDDNETRTLNFRMPKIYKGLDMSGYTIEINYINAKGKADSALAGNIQVGDEEITFQWCAGGTAYAEDGKVRFLVYTYLENEDGTRTNEWHTTWARLEVLEGGNVDEQIAEENPRIIEEMLRRIRELENGETGGTKDAVQYIEQELTDEQKAQARVNIGAVSEEEVSNKVKQAISEQSHFRFVKVDALPDIGEENVIYLVPSAQEESNIYEEYLFVDGVPELIGNTQIDLSGYAPKATTLAGYGITDGATKEEVTGLAKTIADCDNIFAKGNPSLTVNAAEICDDIQSMESLDELIAKYDVVVMEDSHFIRVSDAVISADEIQSGSIAVEATDGQEVVNFTSDEVIIAYDGVVDIMSIFFVITATDTELLTPQFEGDIRGVYLPVTITAFDIIVNNVILTIDGYSFSKKVIKEEFLSILEETGGNDTLTWDGGITGKESVEGVYFKISDVVPSLAQIKKVITFV